MKQSNLLLILILIFVLQTFLLLVLIFQNARELRNQNDFNEDINQSMELITERLSQKIIIQVYKSDRDPFKYDFHVDITNENSESITYVKGSLLFYDNQNQLVHTQDFEDSTLIPGNFTRMRAYNFVIHWSIPDYAYYEVIFEQIILA